MKQPNIFKFVCIAALLGGIFFSFKKSDTIAIVNYEFQGCFGGGESSLSIYKTDTTVTAKLEGFDSVTLTANLSATQLDTFKIFIHELKNLKEQRGCTTVSHYTVAYQGETINKTDGGCKWHGFDKLIACLFRDQMPLQE